ncbi:hypothetical protein N0V93_009636 [Gnomoniopsis smithogilvyi]|uniref:Altered inheritance of mitochondria protein 11 n=1 Tax=Gnomoniopsis smithogilvyi TaxID=1191159 RepID=A0A9W8YL74_9PEZI|nr:hypothetical protein N0V93_009636 [Gnomoniopsis smithogilvyi]
MGWGWPFSSFSSPAPAPPKQNDAAIQNYQLELMRLEKERLELMIKLKQEEAARQAPQIPTRSVPVAQRASPAPAPPPTREDPWRRSAKQLGLFFAGATFLTASVLVSRRAVNRKMVASYPKLFQPSHHGPRPPPRGPKEKGDDQLVAVEALGLATLNVISFGVMATGGLMFAFDISNVEELRMKARSSLYGPNGVVDEAAEQQVEDWIVDVLARRDGNEGKENDQKKDS